MSGEFEKMTFEVDGGVAIVTLNRPEEIGRAHV